MNATGPGSWVHSSCTTCCGSRSERLKDRTSYYSLNLGCLERRSTYVVMEELPVENTQTSIMVEVLSPHGSLPPTPGHANHGDPAPACRGEGWHEVAHMYRYNTCGHTYPSITTRASMIDECFHEDTIGPGPHAPCTTKTNTPNPRLNENGQWSGGRALQTGQSWND